MKDIYRKIFHFLARKDPVQKADLIMGFGHFDWNIPKHCCDLYTKGYGKIILFTGGIGAGSGDFKEAEAIEFLRFANENYPQIDNSNFIIEDKSTHTGDNMRFSIQKMEELSPDLNFNNRIRSAFLVATPARQLRVYQTAKMYLPSVKLINSPPETSFEENVGLFESKGEDFYGQLRGEMDRLLTYPEKNFCDPVEIPDQIRRVYEEMSG